MLSKKKQRKRERKGKNILMRSNIMSQGDLEMQQHLQGGQSFPDPCQINMPSYIPELLQRQLGYKTLGVFCDPVPSCH